MIGRSGGLNLRKDSHYRIHYAERDTNKERKKWHTDKSRSFLKHKGMTTSE